MKISSTRKAKKVKAGKKAQVYRSGGAGGRLRQPAAQERKSDPPAPTKPSGPDVTHNEVFNRMWEQGLLEPIPDAPSSGISTLDLFRKWQQREKMLNAGRTPPTPVTFLRDASVSGPNGMPVEFETGGYRSVGLRLGDQIADCVYNGFPSPNTDPRWPDPFSLVKTGISVVTNMATLLPQAGAGSTDYKYGTYFFFRGSPYATFWEGTVASSLKSSSSSAADEKANTAGAMDWAASAARQTGDWGVNSANYYSRPLGAVLDLKFELRGLPHEVSVCALPIEPVKTTDVTSSPTGWPTNISSLPSAQQVAWGVKQFTANGQSKGIRFVTLPIDSRGLDFAISNAERKGMSESSGLAWSSWAIWINGLSAADSCQVVCSFTEEIIPKVITTGITMPLSHKPSSSLLMDSAIGVIERAAEAGLNAYNILSEAVNIGSNLWSKGKKLVTGLFGGASTPGAMAPAPNRLPVIPQRHRRVIQGDEKPDEQEESTETPPLIVEQFRVGATPRPATAAALKR